ncbi:pimeloyl-ACP methyl esterase BioG family protein [Suttonella ornithocola]|uniref:Uncharacterized protein conserved in bacteria n=1 Tax=Suttonella ornithocola TaxID=279832 RepID=A0A380MNI9_9GAMM|nr:pimeloyl-ACP methyl esterase BioG family protein [Suttonella ornithocola]SUO93291.1 Uncharacterized protein conserved in bacteria [Suttonella ornithocola]
MSFSPLSINPTLLRTLPILFYNGWGMDENVIAHLQDRQVIYVQNYPQNPLELNSPHILIAWSMGVWAANPLLAQRHYLPLTIAINGTPWGIHSEKGMPPRLFQATAARYQEKSQAILYQKLFGTIKGDFLPHRSIPDQQQELFRLLEIVPQHPPMDYHWDIAIISTNDKIYPTDNQKNHWKGTQTTICPLNTPHYPFANFHHWTEFFDYLITA